MKSLIEVIITAMVLLKTWRFFNYLEKLYTYKSYNGKISPFDLANVNFEHRVLDIVVCQECNLNFDVKKFTENDDPMFYHKKHSKNCYFVKCFIDVYKTTKPKVEEIVIYWMTLPLVKDFIKLKLYTPNQIELGLKRKLESDFQEFKSIDEMTEFFQKFYTPSVNKEDINIKRYYYCKFFIDKTPRQATHIVIPCGHLSCTRCASLFNKSSKCLHCRNDIVLVSEISF